MKIVKIITGILVIASFASCTLNEEIDLSTPGKGQYLIHTDMSQAMEMMKSMGGGQMPDSIKDKAIDTTFSLEKEIDSLGITLSPEEAAYYKNGTMHMLMNMPENKFNVEIKYPVKDIVDLKKFFKVYYYVDSVKKVRKKEKEGTGENAEGGGSPGLDNMSNMFSGMPSKGSPYIITDSSIQRIALTTEAITENMGEEMKGMEMFMSQMIMTITIKLPRPVKETKGDMIKVLDDKRTVVFSSSFSEMKDDPSKTEFYIKF
jgi:hypothetical protein